MNRLMIAAALALCATGAPTIANAGEVQVAFRYLPHELQSSEAIALLYQRLRAFAKAECDSGSPYPVFAERACRRDVEAQLIGQIGDSRLAEFAAASR